MAGNDRYCCENYDRVKRNEVMMKTHLYLLGDLPKQVKVKKLSKLKTLDTKPGHMTDLIHLFYFEGNPVLL